MENLENIIEAILLVSGDAVQKVDILDKLNILEEELDKAVQKLKAKYDKASGVQLITFKDKLQFSSNSDYADEIASVLNPIREKKLSKAMLEAMAIIAYKQPITRLEVENVRGVNSDYALQNLLKHNLIEVVGRKDAIGKPMLFGTTDEFLKRFELQNINDLPNYEELLESITLLNVDKKTTLYNEFEIVDDDERQAQLEAEQDFEDLLQAEKDLKAAISKEDFLKEAKFGA